MKFRIMTMVGFGVLTAGCYSMEPVVGAKPDPGRQVALEITDAGRLALAQSMGPSIDQVTGRLVSADSAEFVVSVREVRSIRGDVQVWRGEVVRISTPHVSRVYLKEFSRGRTILFTTAAVAVTGLLLGKGFTNFFPDGPDVGDTLTENPTFKGRRRPLALPPTILRLTPPRSY